MTEHTADMIVKYCSGVLLVSAVIVAGSFFVGCIIFLIREFFSLLWQREWVEALMVLFMLIMVVVFILVVVAFSFGGSLDN